MRTKALLLGAMIGAASLATSMAQVYSVNIVGYINVPIGHGWNLIANQLNNTAGNTIGNLFPSPTTSIAVYVYDAPTQNYLNANWDPRFGWDDDSIVVDPGAGMFVYNPGTAWTATFVGEVKTGAQTINLVHGWQLIAPVVPQTGLLETELNYTPSPSGDAIYVYDNATQNYFNYNWDSRFGWDEEPVVEVGKGMFVLRTSAGAWTRTFNVGP
jgi:hypothetical protein